VTSDGEREVLRERVRAFLTFLRPKLLSSGADLDRLSQLRRLSDVRIRQFAVGKPRVTGQDLCGLLADPKTGRFDVLADGAGLVRAAHLAAALEPLGEEMGLLTEACLTQQVLGSEPMGVHLKDFVAAKGAVAAPAPSAAAPRPAPAALPPAVARLLGTVKDLWSLPANAVRVLQRLEAPDARADVVGAEIEKDPALAGPCLRLVNAMSHGAAAPVTSLKRAVVALGFPLTHRVVVVSALTSALGRPHGEVPFDLNAYWTHALRTAHFASLVSRTAKLGHPDEHFAAGLLHDVGKLVVYQHLRGPMKEILADVAGGQPYGAAEMRVLGVDHAAIGTCVCERWRLPRPVVAAVRHHLDPADVLEEIQLPREALVVAAACRLVGEPGPDAARWTSFLRVPAEKAAELRAEAARRAEAGAKEFA
jgi:HD-like signal output (HDOD) protein